MKDDAEFQWGFFALVSYVPDPLGSFLDDLRRTLGTDSNARAHITLLPPRSLRMPLEEATNTAGRILQSYSPFEIELRNVRQFPNYLYLDVGAGNAGVRELHETLNSGKLTSIEDFPFLPHVTIGGPLPADAIEDAKTAAEEAWSWTDCSKRFTIDAVACLWAATLATPFDWRLACRHNLAEKTAVAAAVTNRT